MKKNSENGLNHCNKRSSSILLIFCFKTYLYWLLAFTVLSASSIHGRRTQANREGNYWKGIACPPAENGQFNHPKYCDKFLNCWGGDPVVGQCPNGLLFNQQNSACDYPQNVDCSGREDSRPPLLGNPECPKPYGTFTSPSNCSEFIVCQEGNGTTYSCPHELFYNDALGVCTYKEDSFCVEINPSLLPPNSSLTETSTGPSPPAGSTSVPIITPPPSNPEHPTTSSQPVGLSTPQTPQQPGENEPPYSTANPLPIEGPSDADHILWPAWPNWPTMKCPIVQGFLPVVGDCEAVVVCLGGFGHFFRCPAGHAFDLTTGKCGPIRITEGCQHNQFPDEKSKSSLLNSVSKFNAKVKYVYLPVNVAMLHQRGNNLNL